MKYLCFFVLMMSATVLMAADPLGKLNCLGEVTVNSQAVRAAAASSYPVVANDDITTLDAPATVYLNDGSRVFIAAKSEVKLTVKDSTPAIKVISGSARVKRAKGSRASVIKSGHEKVIIVGAGAAAAGGAAAAVAATSGGGSKSPNPSPSAPSGTSQ